jgi:hypothetical protein
MAARFVVPRIASTAMRVSNRTKPALAAQASNPGISGVGIGRTKRDGGDRSVHCPIARLPPGHDPGTGCGVATTARQQKGPDRPRDFWIDDAISGSRRGHVGSDANEGAARRAAQADEASRGRPSERTPITQPSVRERDRRSKR